VLGLGLGAGTLGLAGAPPTALDFEAAGVDTAGFDDTAGVEAAGVETGSEAAGVETGSEAESDAGSDAAGVETGSEAGSDAGSVGSAPAVEGASVLHG
jgi:hypothetical protein